VEKAANPSGYNVVMLHGSPGAGKSTLARAISEILRVSDLAHGVIDMDEISIVHPFQGRSFARENLRAIWPRYAAVPGIRLLLSGVGLYGVLNHAVLQRRREIGVRLALGADASRVVRSVVGGAMASVGAGTVVGVVCGLIFGRVADALLFQIAPTDPIAMATPIGMVAVMAVIAALVPAIRAARIDPAQTLRSD